MTSLTEHFIDNMVNLFRILALTLWLLTTGWVQPARTAFHDALVHPSYYETPRGHRLRYAHFKTPFEGFKSTILLLQGRGSFLEYYEPLIVPLLNRGFDVWMYDLSGQGGSSRLLSPGYHDEETARYMQHIDNFDFYVDDAADFVKDVFLPQASGKLILGGYSTGGHVALRYLQIHPQAPFQSVFVISPLLALKSSIPIPAWSLFFNTASLFTTLERYMIGASNEDHAFEVPFETNLCSSDEACFNEIRELCAKHQPFMMGGVSAGWVKAALDSLDCLWDEQAMERIKVPVLIATAGGDGLIDISYNEQFANKLAQGKHALYDQSRHEIFREKHQIRTQWWSDFDAFMSIVSTKTYPFIALWARQAALAY